MRYSVGRSPAGKPSPVNKGLPVCFVQNRPFKAVTIPKTLWGIV